MAHPDRADSVDQLMSALDRPVPVHWDPAGPPSGNGDRVWSVARAGWMLHDPNADFHLLLQDDAMPCPDLLAGLEEALDHVPEESVVSLYLGKGGAVAHRWTRIGERADNRRASWVVSAKLMWGVAIILPTRMISDMIERADRMTGVPDDMRVSGWAQRRHIPVWYTWPSLVDHRAVPSLTKHRAADRRAVRHHSESAMLIDWSGPVVRDPMFSRLHGPRSGPKRNQTVTSPQRRLEPER